METKEQRFKRRARIVWKKNKVKVDIDKATNMTWEWFEKNRPKEMTQIDFDKIENECKIL
jgi:hypothetical protein